MRQLVAILALAGLATVATAQGTVPQAKATVCPAAPVPANIAPTAAQRTEPVKVFGQPRMTKGHPCTIWDKEDIAHYKEMLKTSRELQILVAELKERMDKRIAEPINDLTPQKGPDRKWLYPGNYSPPWIAGKEGAHLENFRVPFDRAAEDVCNLGLAYTLTEDVKYGEYAKKLLLKFAHATHWGVHPGFNMRNGVCISGNMEFVEAIFMTRFAFGYDLICNLPSWTPEERARVHDDFFRPIVACYVYPAGEQNGRGGTGWSMLNNRSAHTVTAVLMAGYATDDQELAEAALYGIHPNATLTPDGALQFPTPKDWTVNSAKSPDGGLIDTFFGPPVMPGGIWVEGSPTYAFYALTSLLDCAEAAWHHGVDLYRNNNGAFRDMFDFPILLSYPDMTTPALNDSARASLYSVYNAQKLYEYAYRRYRDPLYLLFANSPAVREYEALLAKNPQPDAATRQEFYKKGVRSLSFNSEVIEPPSFLFDLEAKEIAPVPQLPSVNYSEVGFGVLRTPTASGSGLQNNLILCYGPSASHGHPDKLGIDLFAFGDVFMPVPGVIFPYENPLDEKWFHTTLAHNTLTVDEKSQITYGGVPPKGVTNPHADQLVFAPAAGMGMERAWSDTAYSGVTMDRAVFLTRHYMADLFGAFSDAPHKYDLAWHIRGELASDLKLNPAPFPEPVANGYNALTNVRRATSDKEWSATLTRGKNVARFFGTTAGGTEVIVGDGGGYVDATLPRGTVADKPPTIIERRDGKAATVYGNAVDISGEKDGYIKSLSQEGGLDAGYGLLKVNTVNGADLCFVSYHPGNYKIGKLETDAIQALVQMNGDEPQALYLAGGKSLTIGGASLSRSEPGLAYVEKLPDGSYVVGNPSSTDATVTVQLPGVAGATPFTAQIKAGGKVPLGK
jgi:hypothetical protein